jgi:hypothetical protein
MDVDNEGGGLMKCGTCGLPIYKRSSVDVLATQYNEDFASFFKPAILKDAQVESPVLTKQFKLRAVVVETFTGRKFRDAWS